MLNINQKVLVSKRFYGVIVGHGIQYYDGVPDLCYLVQLETDAQDYLRNMLMYVTVIVCHKDNVEAED